LARLSLQVHIVGNNRQEPKSGRLTKENGETKLFFMILKVTWKTLFGPCTFQIGISLSLAKTENSASLQAIHFSIEGGDLKC
jgi:hypothetical protein